MFKMVCVAAGLLFSTVVFAFGPPAPNCDDVNTFVMAPVLNGYAPKCTALCQTVRPPQCADVDGVFPIVLPKKQKSIGNYDAVVCTDIKTFPTVTKPDGSVYPKCVQKCQGTRPPVCVDYNSELQ